MKSGIGCRIVPILFALVCFGFLLHNSGIEKREREAWRKIALLSETKWKDEIGESELIDDLREHGFELSDPQKIRKDGKWMVNMRARKEYRIDAFGSFANVWWQSEDGLAKKIRVQMRPYAL